MGHGLTRSEQIALIGVIGLVVAGLWAQSRTEESKGGDVWIDTDGRWEEITPESLMDGLEGEPGRGRGTPREGNAPIGPNRSTAAIDINTASEVELDRLKNIGPARARSIVEHRQRNGNFGSVEGLLEVDNIGPRILEDIRPYITA